MEVHLSSVRKLRPVVRASAVHFFSNVSWPFSLSHRVSVSVCADLPLSLSLARARAATLPIDRRLVVVAVLVKHL
jgi:hypothetical protein